MGARARAQGILHFVVAMVCCGEVTGECEPDSCSGTGGQLSATTAYLCCTGIIARLKPPDTLPGR